MALTAAPVRADVLLDETNLVGLPTVAAPSSFSFTAATAQALTLTLTDLQIPAAFTSVQVAVTLGDVLVGSATVNPATHTATLAIPAASGNYTLNVIGTPSASQGLGSFGVCVAPAASGSGCIAAYSFSGNIQTPSATSSSGTSTLNTNFTSTVSGTYTVTLTDDAFPAALQSVSAGVFQGSTPISVGIAAGAPTPVTLAAATSYQLLIAAIANANLPAGLYGIQITDPSGTAVFNRTIPVGTLPAATIVDNTSARALTLSVTDYGYPAPLASVGVAVTEGSTSLASLTAPGSVANFMAAAGPVEIWQYAAAAAQPGVYGASVTPYPSTAAGPSLYSAIKVVNPASVTATSYAFVATIPSAGTYNLVVNDFQFPSAFQTLSATVAQNGTVLTQSSSGDFDAVQGPVVVVVDATPPQTGSGIFGVTVQTGGASPQILLDQTQAVGAVFTTQTVNLGTSGGYAVALTDLGFPDNFGNLAVVVSRGSQVLGKIYAGGTFQFTGIPGSQYVVSIVATPGADDYGLYSLNIASAAPTVTFSASPTSVSAGETTTLTWSSQNATTCTASGSSSWTGSQPTSGSLAVAVSATESLTLTCTGPGGSASQSLSVTATAAPAKSGGGGSMDLQWLAMLGVLLVVCRRRRQGRVVAGL
jgi:plastocyanin